MYPGTFIKKYALKGLIQNFQSKDGSYTECTKKYKKKMTNIHTITLIATESTHLHLYFSHSLFSQLSPPSP